MRYEPSDHALEQSLVQHRGRPARVVGMRQQARPMRPKRRPTRWLKTSADQRGVANCGSLLHRWFRGVYKPALHCITRCPVGRALVRELVRYLLENAYIDFRGDIAMDK